MTNHFQNVLGAAIRSIDETIVPAIDPDHPLALEQAKIISSALGHIRESLDSAYQYDKVQLKLSLDLLTQVLEQGFPDGSTIPSLEAVIDSGARVLADGPSSQEEFRTLAVAANRGVSAVIRAAGEVESEEARRLEATVVRQAQDSVALSRSWFRVCGWEVDPSQVLPLSDALNRLEHGS
ncbi:hypothetical protein EXE58_11025 [Nocardioides seonyuensis]|uniref:Uncharacterized protein n=1 Tax=Nocardioides seonyuensis TaxID=2518371 RepID=A0A4V1BMD0_9ACTN|nr:hypothetical protein [Nocardioides seonyuensis]QBX55942.1 hypothetical protein EXE58_11025 [Nocardioides seonyuensis]